MDFLPSVIRAKYEGGFRIHLTFNDSRSMVPGIAGRASLDDHSELFLCLPNVAMSRAPRRHDCTGSQEPRLHLRVSGLVFL